MKCYITCEYQTCYCPGMQKHTNSGFRDQNFFGVLDTHAQFAVRQNLSGKNVKRRNIASFRSFNPTFAAWCAELMRRRQNIFFGKLITLWIEENLAKKQIHYKSTLFGDKASFRRI